MSKGPEQRLIVSLARIPEGGLTIDERMPREWLTNIPEFLGDEGTRIEGDIQVSGMLTQEGDNLRLQGKVAATLLTICCRCGEEIRCPLESSFQVMILKGSETETEEERELLAADLAQSYYQGEDVDLNSFFQEEVALQVPLQPLCKRECAGLCPICGTNLNEQKCDCKPDPGDPRLAVLRNLKIEN